MNKKLVQILLAALMLFTIQLPAHAEGSVDGQEKLVMILGSKEMIHNGTSVNAAQPLTQNKGVTYVAAKSLMAEIYGKIVYDAKSKQYTMTSGDYVLVMRSGSTSYTLNGVAKTNAQGAPYLLKGTLMIPLRTAAQSFGLQMVNVPKEKK